MPTTAACCDCNCDDKAGLGLPDTITVTFSVTSSGATGMPSDSVIGSCGGNDILADYSESTALIDALASLDFDYVSSSGCCHTYQSSGSETPCGESGYTDLGHSPFGFVFDGAEVIYDLWQNNNATTDATPFGCCLDDYLTMDCIEAGGGSIVITDGTFWIPGRLYAKATLTICVVDTTVTITIDVTFLAEYAIVGATGEVTWLNAGRDQTSCEQYTWESSGSGTPDSGCDFVSGGTLLGDSQDVSGESGATIWDKIKAASWSSDYELALCSIGGGCGETVEGSEGDCIVSVSCFVGDDGDPTIISESNYIYNQECLYSVGTVSIVLADGP